MTLRKAAIVPFLVLVICLRSNASLAARRAHPDQTARSTQRGPHQPSSTLQFSTCNGFANQRLAIVYAVVMAKASHRSLVVPSLLLNGAQLSEGMHLSGNDASSVPFENIYDMTAFGEALESLGVTVVAASRTPPFSDLTVASPDDLAKVC
ncbi:hypothetical protein COCOBI_19-1790 [Coccomyxa sp. Obi]|nr:hypothetical protein COCOBI_19-1790 [Coccomyxa sp. Obi]